jgi:hypothetical protein
MEINLKQLKIIFGHNCLNVGGVGGCICCKYALLEFQNKNVIVVKTKICCRLRLRAPS